MRRRHWLRPYVPMRPASRARLGLALQCALLCFVVEFALVLCYCCPRRVLKPLAAHRHAPLP